MLNQDGLRLYGDEFVSTTLDAVGDPLLSLGHPLLAAYSSHKGGHALQQTSSGTCLLLQQQDRRQFASFDAGSRRPAGRRRRLAQVA